jgi:hypothetical protein
MNPEKAALRYLHTFNDTVREEGLEMHRDGAVKDIYGTATSFQTLVRTPSQIFQCQFRLQPDGRWLGTVHGKGSTGAELVASMQMYLDRAGDIPTEGGTDGMPSLDEIVEEALGRELTVKEQDFTAKVESRYQKWVQKGEIVDHDLVRLQPRWPVESYDALQLWPDHDPPRDVAEFWNYIAYSLAKKNLPWPIFLNAVTHLDAVRGKFSSWEQRAELEKWQSYTTAVTAAPPATVRTPIQLRLQMTGREARAQWREVTEPAQKYQLIDFLPLREKDERGEISLDPASALLWASLRDHWKYTEHTDLKYERTENRQFLARLFAQPALREIIVSLDEVPLQHEPLPLRWKVEEPAEGQPAYVLELITAEGEPITHSLIALPGRPPYFLADEVVFFGPATWELTPEIDPRHEVPAPVIESSQGIEFLQRLGVGLPPQLSQRVRSSALGAKLSLSLSEQRFNNDSEFLFVTVTAQDESGQRQETLYGDRWSIIAEGESSEDYIRHYDRTALEPVTSLLDELTLSWDSVQNRFRAKLTKTFPDKFFQWVTTLPESIEAQLDDSLKSIMADPLKATVRFDVKPAEEPGAIDWFDLKVILEVQDQDISPDELKLLVEAKGGFVRLSDGTWRRLAMELPPEQQQAITHLGIDIYDLSGESHRLHVLQLSTPQAKDIFDPLVWNRLCDRASALKLSVRPEPPSELRATLRPYQIEGFHFLAYLTTNRFGGILADDMGLGKTVQSLCWVLWLRQQAIEKDGAAPPILVVAPKSVLDVWANECVKFSPGLRVQVVRDKKDLHAEKLVGHIDLLVLNYAQLRVNHEKLKSVHWLAVVLDEGQTIKNPDSQSSRAAREMNAEHRLVLTGTPIENRLLDMWSLMAFAMPGVLGSRKYFVDRFDRRKDAEAHIRLGARLRPFLLRRTKGQVALDLPSRTEEDVYCKMETAQEELYQEELARIQSLLLGFKSDSALQKNSFVVLQGLMRLRQICCHPQLISADHTEVESAKMTALFYLLDQLRDSGHKVLVFSQFTSMLDIIKTRLEKEERPYFLLTGQTQNRHEIVANFQESPDPAVFLLSLKAGGTGLNLTAASYVVLYDPWWNPAIENQAIDRTHRIGQTNPVIAYRLLSRNTIEEKIRHLQQQKRMLVDGVLGEESFTKNLTMADMRFLFERDAEPEVEEEKPKRRPRATKAAKAKLIDI